MTTELTNQLGDLPQRIRDAHELAQKSMSVALVHARQAGTLLIEAKRQLGHGEWLPWLKSEVGISPRTCQFYMRVSDRWPEIEANTQRVAHLPLREVQKLLAGPFTQLLQSIETGVAEAVRRLQAEMAIKNIQ